MLPALSTKGNQIRAARGWAGGNYGFKHAGASPVRITSEAVVAILQQLNCGRACPPRMGFSHDADSRLRLVLSPLFMKGEATFFSNAKIVP